MNNNAQNRENYSVGCGIGLGEKSGLSEVAKTEGPLILENVDIVLILVLENWKQLKKKNQMQVYNKNSNNKYNS